MKPDRFFALIPCAGTGSRAGTTQPKQYQEVAGAPLVVHTLRAFAAVSRIARGVLVVSPDDALAQPLLAQHPQRLFELAHVGGATRAESVLGGLQALQTMGAQPSDWVLVHDAARCLVTAPQIEALIDACQDDAVGGLLAHRLADTLKQAHHGRSLSTVDRSSKWLAQTPQMFRLQLLHDALVQAGAQVTDEASALELLGLQPLLVPGSAQNFKVTYPEDFDLARAVLAMRRTEEHDDSANISSR